MQVLEDHHQRLIEGLAQQYPLDRFERAPLLDLPIHLRQGILALDDTQQAEQVRQRIFHRAVEIASMRPANFLAPRSLDRPRPRF